MLENIKLSFQGIWSHKMRSFLTMLGIIIGIAAIIAIVSTIQGTNEQIEKNLIGSGENKVDVQLCQGDWAMDFTYNGVPSGIPSVTEDVIKELSEIDNVVSVAKYLRRQDYDGVYYLNTSLSGGYVCGIDDQYFHACGYVLKGGRGFTQEDLKGFNKVAILDENSEKALFQGDSAIGKTIEIQKEPYVVIGVVTPKEEFEPVINTIEDYYNYSEVRAGSVYIPNTTWPIVYSFDEPENIVLKTTTTEAMTKAGKEAANILNARLSVSDDSIKYKAQDIMEQAKNIQQLSQSTNTMLIWIAGISLLVGGIGVMNIMLVSVTERTSEIGLKKAIGARKNTILGQFLTEAVVLTSLGGIIGVVVGVALAEMISKINETPVAISIPAAIFAVLFSMVIGIVFGLLPSYKAANLDPIEALRRE